MATKSHQRPPEDDWAGLAQNLFGINLDQNGADDDLLKEDLFQVEIPKIPEPVPSETRPASEGAVTAAGTTPAARKPLSNPKLKSSEDPFGAGILEDTPIVDAESEMDAEDGLSLPDPEDEGLTLADEPPAARAANEEADDGLTLAADYDAEGLTLPPDYDDGLTLASELVNETGSEGTSAVREPKSKARGRTDERPPRRKFRKREDAYWDLLENWDWQEITDDDTPRSREHSGFRGGDRGPRRGGDRPRRDRRSSSSDRLRDATESASGGTPRAGSSREDRPRSRDDASASRRSDRPRERGDRGSRDQSRRDDRQVGIAHSEPAPTRRSESLTTRRDEILDDFAFGVFEDEQTREPSRITEPRVKNSADEEFAPSAETADLVVERSDHGINAPTDDVIWDEDDSDVRLTPANREMERLPSDNDVFGESDEQSALPAAERWDESEERSDIRPIRSDDGSGRRPRRRRRRRSDDEQIRSESARSDEGTVFDLSGVLAGEEESPDQVPEGISESMATDSTRDEHESAGERRGRRRRRRRSVERSAGASDGFGEGIDDELSVRDDIADEDSDVQEPEEAPLPMISYGKVPTWEEALRYLLNPNLVGRNLGPEDEFESLEGDPRGSGGSEPISAPPPPRRFRRGGGGGHRGRRPPRS